MSILLNSTAYPVAIDLSYLSVAVGNQPCQRICDDVRGLWHVRV